MPSPPRIDTALDAQFEYWQTVPDHVTWWPEADASDREAFHLEWIGVTERGLRELQRWEAEGRLSSAQRARYDELQRLVSLHRPSVERLLES